MIASYFLLTIQKGKSMKNFRHYIQKMMFILFLFFSVSMALFASQKMVETGSPLYDDLNNLYRLQSKTFPITYYPASYQQIQVALNNINYETLSSTEQNLYDSIQAEVDADNSDINNKSISGKGFITLETSFYGHTNKEHFYKETDAWYPVLTDSPIATAGFEAWIANHGYCVTSVSFGKVSEVARSFISTDDEGDSGTLPDTPDPWYEESFSSNIFSLSADMTEEVDANYPQTAYLSIGGNNWDFLVGRSLSQIGNGTTGNLVVSSQVPYHDMLRLKAYNKNYSLNFQMQFYNHPDNIDNSSASASLTGLSFYMLHSATVKFFNQRLSFTATDSIMYSDSDGIILLNYLNPLMFYHSNYITAHTNSLISLYSSFAFSKGFDIYGQFVLDDYAIPNNETGEPNAGATPNRWGWILGANWTGIVNKKIMTANLETAYTTPFLYLKSNRTQDIVGTYRFFDLTQDGKSLNYQKYFIGYPYGGDAMVGSLTITCNPLSNWKASYQLFGMRHGMIRIDGVISSYPGGTEVATTPTDFNPLDENASSATGEIESTIINSFQGLYNINKAFSFQGGITSYCIWNRKNQDVGFQHELQFNFTATYSL